MIVLVDPPALFQIIQYLLEVVARDVHHQPVAPLTLGRRAARRSVRVREDKRVKFAPFAVPRHLRGVLGLGESVRMVSRSDPRRIRLFRDNFPIKTSRL